MRLFVAVWPPEDVLDRLAAIDRPADAAVRWTTRSQWHVTLHFLGEVAEDAVADVVASVRSAGSTLSPVTASLGDRVARFGRAVAHVEVSGLRPWAETVTDVLDVPPDGRPFVGHVTIARARGRGSVAPVVGLPLPPGPSSWVAGELALVRSELGPGGSRYSNVVAVPVI